MTEIFNQKGEKVIDTKIDEEIKVYEDKIIKLKQKKQSIKVPSEIMKKFNKIINNDK